MKKVVISTLALGMLAWTSCSSDDTPVMQTSDFEPAESGIITTDQAKAIAQAAVKGLSGETDSRATEKQFTDCRISMYPVESRSVSSEQLCYIVNFDDGGYAVVAADKRAPEVLAMNDDGSFAPEKDEAHHFFMGLASEYLSTRDLSGLTPFDSTAVLEPAYTWHNGHRCGIAASRVNNYIKKFNLIKTEWHQGYPYNESCPTEYNKEWDMDMHCPTGCWAIALAQVMAYHKKPSNFNGFYYNWDALTENKTITWYFSEAGYNVARLCSDIGATCNMIYTLEGSSTKISNAANTARVFGYENVQINNGYNENLILSELQNQRPIIIRASEQPNSEGHAWIIDGANCTYTETDFQNIDNNTFCYTSRSDMVYLHCNWGWGWETDSDYNGGFYLSKVFNPHNNTINYDFKYDFAILYNIY